jgi:hypothetical protein
LIFLRGLGAVVAGPVKPTTAPAPRLTVPRVLDTDAQAFAVRFARAYLTWRSGDSAQHARSVASFFFFGRA